MRVTWNDYNLTVGKGSDGFCGSLRLLCHPYRGQWCMSCEIGDGASCIRLECRKKRVNLQAAKNHAEAMMRELAEDLLRAATDAAMDAGLKLEVFERALEPLRLW